MTFRLAVSIRLSLSSFLKREEKGHGAYSADLVRISITLESIGRPLEPRVSMRLRLTWVDRIII